jgi:hypothetical protein
MVPGQLPATEAKHRDEPEPTNRVVDRTGAYVIGYSSEPGGSRKPDKWGYTDSRVEKD